MVYQINKLREFDVLLVDDNEDDILLIEAALSSDLRLHPVHVARDGREAQQYIQTGHPVSIVLLDLNMPVMDGYEFLAWLRNSEFADIPVIVVTTSVSEYDIGRSYREGAATYVTKPSTYEELQTCMKHLSVYWTDVARLPSR